MTGAARALHPTVARGFAYARDVLAGRVPAGRAVKAACRRHLADLKRAEEGGPWAFDPVRAERACRFMEKLPHTKGPQAKREEKLRLEPWQCFIVMSLFGWVDRVTGLRRFTKAYLEVARKNGKTMLVAGIGLYMLGFDGEPGAEVYSAATSRDQAKEVFSAAAAMVRREPRLQAMGLRARVGDILLPATESKFEPLAAQTAGLDGKNPHFAGVDELHEHRKRDLLESLDQGMGSRDQPLLMMITTAGDNIHGVCYEQREFTLDLLAEKFEADHYFGIVYCLDEEDDPGDQANWIKANPNLGVSVSVRNMQGLWAEACRSRAKLGHFKRKRLNIWTSAGEAAIDLDGWRRGRRDMSREDWRGRGGVTGLDLAIRHDLCAVLTAIETEPGGAVVVFGDYHVTERVANEPGNEALLAWADAGRITLHKGAEIKLDRVGAQALEHVAFFGSTELAYDPMYAAQMIQQAEPKLEELGAIAVEIRQTPMNMTEPFERLMSRAEDGLIHHDGDPVLAWMASNTIAEQKGPFIRPGRTREFNKIDGISALITAMARLGAPEEGDAGITIPSDYRVTA